MKKISGYIFYVCLFLIACSETNTGIQNETDSVDLGDIGDSENVGDSDIEDDSVCKEDAFLCSDNSLHQCKKGVWNFVQECGSRICDKFAGKCIDSCPEHNKFCREHNGLHWTDALDFMTWNQAENYCRDIGGRLPTISEFRTIIQNCQATETGGECGVTDFCLSYESCFSEQCEGCNNSLNHSVLGYTSYFWSSSKQTENETLVWVAIFDSASIHHYDSTTTKTMAVACVKP